MFMQTKGDNIFSPPLNGNSTFRPLPELSPSTVHSPPPLSEEGQRNTSKPQQSLLVERASQHHAISVPAVEIDTTIGQPLPLPLPYPYLLPCGTLTQRGSPAPSSLPKTLKSTSRAVRGSVPMDTAHHTAYSSSNPETSGPHHDHEEDPSDRVCASSFHSGRPKNKRATCRFISLVVVSVITLAGLYMVWYSGSVDMRKEVSKSSLEDRGVKVGPVDFLDTAAGAFVAKLFASGAILVVSLLGIVMPLWLTRRGAAAIPSKSEGAKWGRGLGDEGISSKSSSAFLSLGNCFSAGLLLGMGALHFLPEAVEAYQRRLVGLVHVEEGVKSNHTRDQHVGHSGHDHSGEDKFVFLALLGGLCIPLLIDTIQHSLTHLGIISSEHAHSHSHGHGHSHDATRDDKGSDTVVGKPLHSVVVGSGSAAISSESEISKGVFNGATVIGGILVDVRGNASSAGGHAHDEERGRSEAKGPAGHTIEEVCSKGNRGSPYGTFLEESEIHDRSDLLKPSAEDIMNAMGTDYADQRANTTNQSTSRGKQHTVTSSSSSSLNTTATNTSMSSVIILSCLLTFHGLTEGFMLGLEASGTAITSIMVPLCIHKFFDAFVLGLRIVRQMGGDLTGGGGLYAQSRGGNEDVSKKKKNVYGNTSSTSSVAFIKRSFWAVVAVFSTPISLIIIALLYFKGGALLGYSEVAGNVESSSLSSSSSSGGHNTVVSGDASLPHAHRDVPSLAYVASQAVGAGSFLYIALGDILPMEFHGVGLGSGGGGGGFESGAASKGVVAHRWRQLLWIFAGIAFVHAQSIFFPHKH